MKSSVFEIVRDAEDNYLRGTTQIGEYVEFDMHDVIETIDAYLNSKHVSGPKDSLGRDKPFFNIVTAARNIWYRATDIDRKDIRILPDRSENTALAFVATVLLQNWMRKNRFGQFLNEWGRTLASYGSAVVKFVDKGDELVAEVVPWNRLIVDPVDFDSIPRIEKFYRTPAQLRKNKQYDQVLVERLISSIQARKTLDGQQKDNMTGFIELYEVHGELPEALLSDSPNDEPDSKWDNYRQQMHVVSFVETKDGSFEDFCLYKGKEKKDPYMITHLIKEDGRTLGIGAVEHLFDAQWMTNHSMKSMKDVLDLSSKLIFQTADGNYVNRNVLSAIESGDILIHAENKPLTQINNSKADVQAYQGWAQAWQTLAQEVTSTPDAIRGNTMPSGTPYSLAAYAGAQANSLFEIMTENKGLAIEEMMREHILPHLMKSMDTKDEIVAVLDANGIAEIDAMYVPREAVRRFNEQAKKDIIEGRIPSPYQKELAEEQIKQELAPLGNKRFIKPDSIQEKTWKDALKDFEMNVVVEVTNETTDKQAVLTTLSSVLQTVAGNPMILQDSNAKMILGNILKETGTLSPIQLSVAQAQPSPAASPPGGTEALAELAKQNGI